MLYMLDDRLIPKKAKSISEYIDWHQSMPIASDWYASKTLIGFIVARDSDENGRFVSTVYLGFDHNFLGEGQPVLWETWIRSPEGASYRRYETYPEAISGHQEAIEHERA
jgi:hypothetical protein